jgi:hypothetical protein
MTKRDKRIAEIKAELDAQPVFISGPYNSCTGELGFLVAETVNKHVASLEGELRGLEAQC